MRKAILAAVMGALALAACASPQQPRQASAPPAGAGSSTVAPDQQELLALGPPFWVREMSTAP